MQIDQDEAAAQARFNAFTNWLERITKLLVTFSLGPIFFFGAWFSGAFVYGLYDHGFVFYKASDMVQVWLASPFFVVMLILMLGSTSMMICRVISDKFRRLG